MERRTPPPATGCAAPSEPPNRFATTHIDEMFDDRRYFHADEP
ncbi:MAG TPA: hypothetical protein VMV69_03575 [Pirellulales bacterium]|nr:hypothetical protein [Pirellulales bacterium]